MLLTYKYRVKDRSARKRLARYAAALNQVWNYACAYQRDIESRYRAGAAKRKWPSAFDLNKLTSGTSKDLGVHAGSIYEVCRVFVQSRDKAKHSLRFRASNGARRALGWVPFRASDRQIDGNSIRYLGKRFRFFNSERRPIPENTKGGSFNEDAAGHWWLNIVVEVPDDLPHGAGAIGIDLGLHTLATCSDGRKIKAFRHYRAHERKLAVAQRARNGRRVTAIHRRIANCRKDQLHKASSGLMRANCRIVVGNVSASSLAKTKLAKSVLDASWSSFRHMLRYKAIRHGVVYAEIDEKFTSQTCSACGSLPASRPKGIAGLGIREWTCDDCGTVHDRDVNAARNILARSAPRLAEESRALSIPDISVCANRIGTMKDEDR